MPSCVSGTSPRAMARRTRCGSGRLSQRTPERGRFIRRISAARGISSSRTLPVPSSRISSTRCCRTHHPQMPACSRHPSRPQRVQVKSPSPPAQSVHHRCPSGPMPGRSRSVPQPSQIPYVSIAFAKHPEQISPSGQRGIQTSTTSSVLPGCSRRSRTRRSQRAQRVPSLAESAAVTRRGERSGRGPDADRRYPSASRAGRQRRSCGPRC